MLASPRRAAHPVAGNVGLCPRAAAGPGSVLDAVSGLAELAYLRVRRCRRLVGQWPQRTRDARRQPESRSGPADREGAESQFERSRSARGLWLAAGFPRYRAALHLRSWLGGVHPRGARPVRGLAATLRAEFVLGAQLIERGATLQRGVYHVSHNGSLLAVLDLHEGKCAISPSAHPVDLWEAEWAKRPVGARDMPPGFVPATPARLAWAYVRRTDRDLLPPRYRTDPIYYRHVPRVPVRWLHDSQLLLLRELSVEPGTFEALRQRTGFSVKHLEHDLACLYYATAITTTRPGPRSFAGGRDSTSPRPGRAWISLVEAGRPRLSRTGPGPARAQAARPKSTPGPRLAQRLQQLGMDVAKAAIAHAQDVVARHRQPGHLPHQLFDVGGRPGLARP